tara:strand:+ start:637 stop:741 length:105 start_codon:yes stop_codon:yes gene_type:complete
MTQAIQSLHKIAKLQAEVAILKKSWNAVYVRNTN